MKFHEGKHIYFNDEGEHYTSGTALIKKFCKPFERDKIAAKFAKKNKRTIQDVLDEWKKLGDDAIKKGIAFHKLKENELSGLTSVLIEQEEHPVFQASWEDGLKINNLVKLEPGIYPELIVWSDKYKIAGQADYVEITKTGKINIKDYKTSKEIKLQSFRKWDGTPDMMKFPLTNLEDCNFNHYALQLNLYAFLIRQHNRNLEIGKLTVEHILGDYDGETDIFSLKETIEFDMPNLQDEIRVILEYFKNQ